jgi:DNA-binding NarL/FixJ family response regulator
MRTTSREGRGTDGTQVADLAVEVDPVLTLLDQARVALADDPKVALSSVVLAVGLLRDRCASGVRHLTPSEERVVLLAAIGTPNHGIAEKLFLSVRTVESHLSHAYEKLGVRTKSELAAWWAVERGT